MAIASTQAWALPTAGQVKNGFALCDGNSYASLPANKYHPSLVGNRPNLSDSRFLSGSTSLGSTGGSNSITMTSSHMPQVTTGNQSANHAHTHSGSVAAETQNHTHGLSVSPGGYVNADHYHASAWTGGGDARHYHNFSDYWLNPGNSANANSTGNDTRVGANVSRTLTSHGINQNHTHGGSTAGASANHSHSWGATSGGVESNHQHSISGTSGGISTSHTHSYSNASPSPVDNKPTNLTVVFLMKVK